MEHRTATVSVFHCLRKHSRHPFVDKALEMLDVLRLPCIMNSMHFMHFMQKHILKSKAPGCHCSANVQISAWLRLTRLAVAMVPNWNDVPGQSKMHESLCSGP